MALLLGSFVSSPMRKIVQACWSSSSDENDSNKLLKRSIMGWASEVGHIHKEMESRLCEVAVWLQEEGIHAYYVDVMIEELDMYYLRPSVFIPDRRDFCRFRGTGSHVFSLPAILALYILGKEAAASAREAIRQGVKACHDRKRQLDASELILEDFGLEISTPAKTHLLRTSLKLQPCYFLDAAEVVVQQHCNLNSGATVCNQQEKLMEHVSKFLWFRLSAESDTQLEHTHIRDCLQSFYDSSSFGIQTLLFVPWTQRPWEPCIHKHVVHRDARRMTVEALKALARYHITTADLCTKIFQMVFSTTN